MWIEAASSDTPPSVSHCRRVKPESASGSPAAKPSAAMTG